MKVGVVGLGLMGGSLGLDLRSQGHQVFGVARREQTCQLALQRGVVDRVSVNLGLLKTTDLIFICTPIAAIAPTVEQLIPFLRPETVLTDIGSVKMPILEAVGHLWHNFVGGHPMAGTAQQGIEAAQLNLFVDAPYVLTPLETTPAPAVKSVREIVLSLGCQVYQCSPQEHDRAVAWISHLPVMVSSSLIQTCLGEQNPEVLKLAQSLASSGFRDTSRVGGGNPELGRMMAQYNQKALLDTLQQYRQNLDNLVTLIEQENWKTLEQNLQLTAQARPQFVQKQ